MSFLKGRQTAGDMGSMWCHLGISLFAKAMPCGRPVHTAMHSWK